MKSKIPFDLKAQITDKLPTELKNAMGTVQDAGKSILSSGVEQLNLVTREEFEVQRKVLLKTRERLEQLEARVDQLLADKEK